MKIKLNKLSVCLPSVLFLASCQLTGANQEIENTKVISDSFLRAKDDGRLAEAQVQNETPVGDSRVSSFTKLESIDVKRSELGVAEDFKAKLDNTSKNIKIAADGLNLSAFIHHLFGELLSIDYVLDDKAAADSYTVSLNLKEGMTALAAFELAEDLLEQREYTLVNKNNVLYVIAKDTAGQSKSFSYGIGKEAGDLPSSGQDVFQVVPLLYSSASSYSLILRSISNAQFSQSRTGNLLFLSGKREDVAKALEFVRLIDQPNALAQHIGVINLVFNDAEDFATQLKTVMEGEGISVGINDQQNSSVVLVPLVSKGMIIAFAKSDVIAKRVDFWTKQLDVASNKGEVGYFIYHPRYARAADLGESLSAIVDVSGGSSNRESNNSAANPNKASQPTSKRRTSVNSNSNITVAVDERSNTLIINGTGVEYQKLLPIIKSLDILPKQVFLEMTLAEVTLRDDFKKGVEFAYGETSGNNTFSLGTDGALGLDAVGGFSYSFVGQNGNIRTALSQDNSLVNILSRPSLVVRDGVTASITVGTDIPVVGSTTTDPIGGERETTSIDYRKTGIELEVTPTVNAQGVVIMNINQKISNTVDGGAVVNGSPSIFERSVTTEVVANSGQTIVLGGLISENNTVSESKVPFFGDIPLIGHLFRVDTDLTDKTELVILVTPQIIQREEEWGHLKSKFFNALDSLKFESDTSRQ
ncbi:secretin N-terminal domain-containing protein [Thalassotalea euphylliae]|uniref:General secretion pathway protein GspD n=1 Tax=Thalassotalea euphylliae TaxID=1655234 RepID=A0A3E0UE89_9GAMM|nr:secretin N-terminal domain-containing protein [Thalassotalea euphylliae]REL34893.1 general secretion pathway protein GspD [Thalassotalea euphylliae]